MTPKLDKATISLFEEPMPKVLHPDDKKPAPSATPDRLPISNVAMPPITPAIMAAMEEMVATPDVKHADRIHDAAEIERLRAKVAELEARIEANHAALDQAGDACNAEADRSEALRERVAALEARDAVEVRPNDAHFPEGDPWWKTEAMMLRVVAGTAETQRNEAESALVAERAKSAGLVALLREASGVLADAIVRSPDPAGRGLRILNKLDAALAAGEA